MKKFADFLFNSKEKSKKKSKALDKFVTFMRKNDLIKVRMGRVCDHIEIKYDNIRNFWTECRHYNYINDKFPEYNEFFIVSTDDFFEFCSTLLRHKGSITDIDLNNLIRKSDIIKLPE